MDNSNKVNHINLSDYCTKYKFDNKRIIMPSNGSGYQYLFSKTEKEKYGSMLNINTLTLRDLAKEILTDSFLQEGYTLVEPLMCIFILMDILNSNKKELQFFHRITPDINMAKAVYKNLTELRLACIDLKEFVDIYCNKTRDKKDPQKIKELIFVADKFKEDLNNRKYIDYPGLLAAALERLNGSDKKTLNKLHHYAIPQNSEMEELEGKFFEKLTEGEYQVIIMPQPTGYKTPKNFVANDVKSSGSVSNSDITPIRKETIGKANEVKEVLRDIKINSRPLDQVLILYTGKEYAQIAYDLFSRYRISATFGSGISIINSKAYCFLQNLMDWIMSDYEVKYLLYMLRSGNIDFAEVKGSSIKNNYIAKTLENMNIGWGSARYESLLESNNGEGKQESEYAEKNKKVCEIIDNFFKDVTQNINIVKGKVDFPSFSQALLQLTEKYIIVKSEQDASGKKCIINTLKMLSKTSKNSMDLNQAIKYIKTLIRELSYANSKPEPGHVHIAPIEQGVWNERPYLYIVGLTDEQLKGNGIEDPILDDSERKILSESLKKSSDAYTHRVYKLIEALATERKSIMGTCSGFDTVALKATNTNLTLKGIEFKDEGKKDSNNYHALNLDEMRVLTKSTACDKATNADDPHEHNQSLELSDNSVPDKSPDPDNSHSEATFSATKLEDYARCPRLYLFKYLLKLKKKDPIIEKDSQWLKTMDVGTLYHKILQNIYKDNIKNLLDNNKAVQKVVTSVVENYANEAREDFPCPSDEIFESWKSNAVEYLVRYINSDIKRLKTEELTPCGFELTFREKDSVGDLGDKPIDTSPLELEFGDIKITLTGAIDRIDKDKDGNFEIVDYKSGKSKYFYDKNNKVDNKHFQHYLYSLALSKILERAGKKNLKITKARYEFFKEDTQAAPILLDQDLKQEMYNIVKELLESMKDDTKFIKCIDNKGLEKKALKDAKSFCTDRCDYRNICAIQTEEEGDE